ncbi:MAG: hypothetical protein J0M33_14315 [Anaerolineae bacterium]|nr:hypothetical protein [Anaerolineae bacterium]
MQRNRIATHSLLALICVIFLSTTQYQIARAQTFIVPNGDVAQLANAIAQANNEAVYPGANVIELAENGNYVISAGFSSMVITSLVTIEGNNATLTLDTQGQAGVFVFSVFSPGVLTLNDINADGSLTTVYIAAAQAIVNNSSFRNNSYGRAIYSEAHSILTVNETSFDNYRSVAQGSAIYSLESIAVINDSTFTNNRNTPILNVIGDMTLNRVTIANNPASHAVRSYVGNLSILHSTISNHVSGTQYGGAVAAEGTTLLVEDTYFSNNSNAGIVPTGYDLSRGGAILVDGPSAIIRRSTFEGNFSSSGGAIFTFTSSPTIIEDSVFINNRSFQGGAITSNSYWGISVLRSTFRGNGSSYGGAISFGDGASSRRSTITQSVFESNTATVGGGAIWIDYPAYNAVEVLANNNCFVGNSNLAVINNYLPIAADFTNNWWGATDGPSGLGTGFGDSIGGNVNFTPFLQSAPPGCSTLVNLTPTVMPSATATNTSTATATFTPTSTETSTPTATYTATETPSPTLTYTWTPSPTFTATFTALPPTFTPTFTATWTPIPPPTATSTNTPAQAIQNLINVTGSYNLQQGINNSLDAKLQSAYDALNQANGGNVNAAINKLQAFINEVEAQRDNKITGSQADILIGLAQQVIVSLGG